MSRLPWTYHWTSPWIISRISAGTALDSPLLCHPEAQKLRVGTQDPPPGPTWTEQPRLHSSSRRPQRDANPCKLEVKASRGSALRRETASTWAARPGSHRTRHPNPHRVRQRMTHCFMTFPICAGIRIRLKPICNLGDT